MEKISPNQISLWNSISDYWDKRMGDEGDWCYRNIVLPTILNLIGKVGGQRILDGGCGTGSLSRYLAKNEATVVGVDISPGMLSHAIRRENEVPLGIDYRCIDLEDLSKLLLDPFDIVISDFIMQDSEDCIRILSELRQNVKLDGKLIAIMEHPFFTIFDDLHITTKRKWVGENKGIFDCKEVLLRYKRRKKIKILWEEELYTYTNHLTLEEYTTALSKCGFVIKTILEPTAPSEKFGVGPIGNSNLALDYPLFLFLEAIPTEITPLNRKL